MDTQQNRKKDVFAITEKPADPSGNRKSYWVKVGVGFLNRDGSYTIRLDALPVNGVLQMRDERAWPDRQPRESSSPPPSNQNAHADIFGAG